ncbi:MAG: hypothetical protein F6K19_37065 [Cyanothece sp. SIO1E1]|nr:hypothetical protein [Cyanothece sp. SIO1E1]
MKNIAVVIMILMILSASSNAQNGLEYFFSNEVTESLEEYIDSYHKENEVNDFYLVLYHNEENTYKLNIGTRGESDKDELEKILNLTNRFVKINDYKMPIILEEDFKFGVFGRPEVGVQRWFLISEGHGFTIDGRGNIID